MALANADIQGARHTGARLRSVLAGIGCLVALSCPSPASASDHADPIMLDDLEAGLTGLFAFPNEDKLVLILCTRRGLGTQSHLALEPMEYKIFIDHDSRVDFDDESGITERYGGKVVAPEKIEEEVTITIELNNDASLEDFSIDGVIDPEAVDQPWTGIRDDPFIFYRFHTTNVVAMVLEIPFLQFKDDPRDFLIWATSSKFGTQVDHVGRSLRTMLPRFDFLNTLHPSDHVREIRKRHEEPGVVQDVASTFVSPLFAFRGYDFEPDVMVFTRDREPGFPNGRRLEDDVAKLCCDFGECLLWEVSTSEAVADGQPRPSKNNVPFLAEYPYLAPPNMDPEPFEPEGLRTRTLVIGGAVGVVVLALLVGPWMLLLKCRRRLARLRWQLQVSSGTAVTDAFADRS